ncbi:MAG: hypothetical protein M1813_003751 [Trichoglossum hirsutum]|nr:MAG: hypothetical protein M1813_003751 [Trichoglossum hirsutum]
MTRAQKGKKAAVQDRYTRKRKQTTPAELSPETFQPPQGARCYLTELPMELYSLIMHHLLEEPLHVLRKSSDPPIRALSSLARTSSALNRLTVPFLYEDISVRMSPGEPLCVPPSGSGPSKKRSRILAGLGLSQGDSAVSSDSHKLLYSKYNVLQFVKTLRVKASRLSDEERLNSNPADSARKTRSRRGTSRTDGIHTESVISLNLSMLVERMPRLVQLHWEIDNFIGPVLQSALSKSSIELIQVAHQYTECSPIGFLHENHTLVPETAAIPKLDRLQVSCIRRASQLRQIGRLIGFNVTLKQIGLKLHRDFEEDLDEEPEALTLMLHAWMDARKEFLHLPGTNPFCPHQFMLQDLHLSMFPIDEDAEQVLSLVLNHCRLTSLAFRTCCLLSDLSILFSEWRYGKYLRHLIFHTDSVDDHAIDLPSFAEFLTRTGKVNQRLLSLELRGGWKFLNFMEADLEKVKASGVFNSLVKLVWEACVATWCEYCVGQKTKREEMRAFADLAGSCLQLQHLAIPGLFIGGKPTVNGATEHIPPEEDFSHARHAISTLPLLRHLHVQETDQRHPQWAEFPCHISTGTLQMPHVGDSFEDHRFSVKNSPNPSSTGDEVFFGKVSCALARLSMNGKTVDDFPVDHFFFSVTFGLWGESRHLIWVNRIRETNSIGPDKGSEEGWPADKRRKTDQDEVVRLYYRRILETSKHLGGPAWIQ